MNERIRQLAQQAEIWQGIEGGYVFSEEKFAQLIVRECIDTAFHRGHPDLEFLLKHFGVEL